MTETERQIWRWKGNAKVNATYYRKRVLHLRQISFALEMAMWVCGALSVLQWLSEHASKLVPVFSIGSGFFLAIWKQMQLPQRITKLDHCIGLWDKQAKEWNALWLRAHESYGSITASDVTRLRGYDPPDLEGEVARSQKSLDAATEEGKRSRTRVVPDRASCAYSLTSCSRSITSRTVSQRLSAISS